MPIRPAKLIESDRPTQQFSQHTSGTTGYNGDQEPGASAWVISGCELTSESVRRKSDSITFLAIEFSVEFTGESGSGEVEGVT